MNFKTELFVNKATRLLRFEKNIVSLGSCFADTLGNQLGEDKFKILSNPFGIIYNPISLFDSIYKPYDDMFLEREGMVFNYHFHSSISALDKQKLEEIIQYQRSKTIEALRDASHLFITLGSAWVYELVQHQKIVANCHKKPINQFTKRLLTIKEIHSSFSEFQLFLKQINPELQLVFTLSPVRHLKDTLELNAVSKSLLRLFCYEITKEQNNISYFPAYELLIDDLRDYRFYAEDLLHPSSVAQQYILNKFYEAYLEKKELKLVKNIREVVQGIKHRPLHVSSDAYRLFLKSLLEKTNNMNKYVDFSNEIIQLETRLSELA